MNMWRRPDSWSKVEQHLYQVGLLRHIGDRNLRFVNLGWPRRGLLRTPTLLHRGERCLARQQKGDEQARLRGAVVAGGVNLIGSIRPAFAGLEHLLGVVLTQGDLAF